MKLEHINPNHVDSPKFRAMKLRNCGNWSFHDTHDANGVEYRNVFHRSTMMGYFKRTEPSYWYFEPVSTGWGSASDQQGMNKIMPLSWRFRRNGGNARYELGGDVYKSPIYNNPI